MLHSIISQIKLLIASTTTLLKMHHGMGQIDKPIQWLKFLNYIFKPNGWVCPYLTQTCIATTQRML